MTNLIIQKVFQNANINTASWQAYSESQSRSLQFVGDTLEEQWEQVNMFAQRMVEGRQEMEATAAEYFVTEPGETSAEITSQLFEWNDSLLYQGAEVITAAAEEVLLDILEEAGAALLILLDA